MNENKTRTEYALDYGAGLMCVSDDSTDAAEMQQHVPGSRVVARTVTESEWEPVEPKPAPAPSPDLSLIPSSREEARVLEINGVVREWWQGDSRAWSMEITGEDVDWIALSAVDSVREVHVLADDRVAVDRGDLVALRRAKQATNLAPDQRELAHALDDLFSYLPGGWSAGAGVNEKSDTVRVSRELVERAEELVNYWDDETGALRQPGFSLTHIVRDLAAVDRGEGA